MRFRRIRLRNYRGIIEREVILEPRGVTVLVAPNECGKTSMTEALDLLFDELDSAKKKRVRDVKPVDRDEGPEVEVDVETGHTTFTYAKRFLKRPTTRLTISHPRPESLTGREAHNRVRELLEGEVDLPLWRALRIQQGTELGQPGLSEQQSLAAALDHAAGQARVGPGEESLFTASREEFERFFTPTGRPGKELRAAADALSRAEEQVTELQHRLAAAEDLVQQAAEVAGRLGDLRAELPELARAGDDARVALEEVTRLEGEHGRLEQCLLTAEARFQAARTQRDQRNELIARVEQATSANADLIARRVALLPDLGPAERRLQDAEAALAAAEDEAKAATRLLRLRNADFDFRRAQLDLEQLQERSSRIERAVRAAEAAQQVLDTTRIDDPLLEQIREAHHSLVLAKGRVEAGSPSVEVEALSELEVHIDAEPRGLGAGKVVELPVPDETVLEFPGVARVTIRPGMDATERLRAQREAEREFERLLTDAGVGDPPEAIAANDARKEAERIVRQRDERVAENLRDLSRDDLARKIAKLAARSAGYSGRREPRPAMADDFDTAQDAAKDAAKADGLSREAVERASHDRLEAHARHAELVERKVELRGVIELTGASLNQVRDTLERARTGMPDDALNAALEDTERDAQRTRAEVERSGTAIGQVDPARVRALAANATAALGRSGAEERELENRQLGFEARLEQIGEGGLAERLGEALSRHRGARRAQASIQRRANAARLLFETLRSMRNAARRAYVRPLSERIEELGRYVFGSTFQVELDDDLKVVNRTLRGTTVPFDSLSAGAKEQISLLARLACALIVSSDGGVPLILDDALGYTDPERLKGIGAVLALAGERCQVIVLTCSPGRFRHVGDARVMTLAAPPVIASAAQ